VIVLVNWFDINIVILWMQSLAKFRPTCAFSFPRSYVMWLPMGVGSAGGGTTNFTALVVGK